MILFSCTLILQLILEDYTVASGEVITDWFCTFGRMLMISYTSIMLTARSGWTSGWNMEQNTTRALQYLDRCDKSDQHGFIKCERTFPFALAWRIQTHMVPQREHSRNILHSVTTKRLPVCHQSTFMSLGWTVYIYLIFWRVDFVP